ncbi:uncharacterized protein LOC120429169 [Culex pipiens pallens]|uniref:uncharacterized protein LOC120429169 n=1 Tax=Culex pipiens pallens TaxID=42434 RepID=UPI00195477AA|nr:uncharacterized protein LOC120429169 [Culex pipiens pallens]
MVSPPKSPQRDKAREPPPDWQQFIVTVHAVTINLFVLLRPIKPPPPSPWQADYTLDDSFWNEESPVGEVERLLKEHQQNQELVDRIGSNFYQIIYPVQLRHHEKMGISTREVGAKYPQPRGRSRVSYFFL